MTYAVSLVVSYDSYVYLVSYIEEDDYLFPKTVIPSRKATRDYLNRSIASKDELTRIRAAIG